MKPSIPGNQTKADRLRAIETEIRYLLRLPRTEAITHHEVALAAIEDRIDFTIDAEGRLLVSVRERVRA